MSTASLSPPIIRMKDLQSLNQKMTSAAFLLIGWSIILYFLLPFFMLLGWALASYLMGTPSSHLDEVKKLMDYIVVNYSMAILCFWGAFFMWSMYNKIRFSGKRDIRSRGKHRTVSNDAIAEHFTISVDSIDEAQSSKIMTAAFDDAGAILSITRQPIEA